MSWRRFNDRKIWREGARADGPHQFWYEGSRGWCINDDSNYNRKNGPQWINSNGDKWFKDRVMESL